MIKTWPGFRLPALDRRYGLGNGESDKTHLMKLLKETTPESIVRRGCGI